MFLGTLFIVAIFASSLLSYGAGKFELWLKWQDGYHEGYQKAMKEVEKALNYIKPDQREGK